MIDLTSELKRSPVIAAVRDEQALRRAVRTQVSAIFLLGADLFTLSGHIRLAREAGKLVFVHLDLVEGISRDTAGARWIAKAYGPSGVLSTRAPLLKAAAEEGLLTVLRMFMVDSSSLATGERMVKGCSPSLVEVMPGLVTRAITTLSARIAPPVIAGGMLEREQDVRAALAAGALAASTSSETLWRREGW